MVDGQPFVIPTLHARIDNSVVVHGSSKSRTLEALAGGADVCLTVTLIDGLVLARSAFHHSVNYRSVTIFGRARALESDADKASALHAFVERLYPGRWNEVREPNASELKATLVLELPLDEAVAKVRTGGPLDDAEDMQLPVWAGVVPLELRARAPIPDAQLAANLPITPGGLGVVEGSLTIALVAYGGGRDSTVAAVLLYSFNDDPAFAVGLRSSSLRAWPPVLALWLPVARPRRRRERLSSSRVALLFCADA